MLIGHKATKPTRAEQAQKRLQLLPLHQLHIFSSLPVMILSGFGTPSRHTMGDDA
jgi:hypothetical protein